MSDELCGAKTRAGHPCSKTPGYGTDHPGYGRCKFHGGASPNGRMQAARLAAQAEAAKLGMAIETDPREALSAVVNIHAGTAAFLQAKVAELDDGDVVTKGDLHPMLRALNGVLDHLRLAAKAAVDADVEGRRLALDELAVEGVTSWLRAVLDDLELTAEQRALLPAALRAHSGLIDTLGQRPRELIA